MTEASAIDEASQWSRSKDVGRSGLMRVSILPGTWLPWKLFEIFVLDGES